jgi:multiple sugar transport system permease protein
VTRRRKWSWKANARHLLSIAISFFLFLPLVWMVVGSFVETGASDFRSLGDVGSLTGENFIEIFRIVPLGRYFANSLLVTGAGVALTLLTASWAGFAMAQLPLRARRWLVGLSIALLMTPVTALWLTRFLMFSWLGASDSYLPLIAPALMGSSALFVLLFYWNFRHIPREMFESGQMDGATPLDNWRLVALPQAKPAVLAVAMLSFLFYWNDFINPLLYLHSQKLYTLPLGLNQIRVMDQTNFPLLLAAALVMTVPALVFFLLAQRALLEDKLNQKNRSKP